MADLHAKPTDGAGAYCVCDDVGCEREHAPLSPGVQASVDAKVAVQGMRLRADGISDPIRFALDTEVWGFTHDAMRLGKDAGRLLEREDIIEWLRGCPTWTGADGTPRWDSPKALAAALEAGEHRNG